MANTILCIFEGEKREHAYFGSLQRHFFGQEAFIKCSYGNDLYHLHRELTRDPDLDVVELIRESTTVPSNGPLLDGLERDDIAQVFLFFDMEPHDDSFSLSTLGHMLQLFNEETEHGKLYISYPMVESLRDIPSFDSFESHVIQLQDIPNYKQLSAERGRAIPSDHRKLTRSHWLRVCQCSLAKARFISTTNSSNDPTLQINIFNVQSIVYEQNQYLFVLSAFPFFLVEYFGLELLVE